MRCLNLFLCMLCLSAVGQDPNVPTGPQLRPRKFVITEADRTYWAFQPVGQLKPPKLGNSADGQNPIDAFLLARLEDKGLALNPPASPREQVRRAYFDLWGLPPAWEEVSAFEAAPTDDAWSRLVDRLLASPHYGERWGRHWLDLVRYAESNGYERDGPKPDAWRYRDYVIESFNEDKPYHQFVREQLAGDELVEEQETGTAGSARGWRDPIIATGFYRLHIWDDEPDSTLAAEFDDLDDIMVTTSTAFLGLTIGCARCHDHKFDPISQADYYSLLSFFRSIDPYGLHKTGGGGRGTGKIGRFLASDPELKRWESEKQARSNDIEQRLAAATDPGAKERLTQQLKQSKEMTPPFEFALAAVENGPVPKPTHLLARGDPQSPREEVMPAFPSVLGFPAPALPSRLSSASSSGRRRLLADWIASPRNPLTARVMVNRLWQHHFGIGIVPTPDDFGRTGLLPTNQPLLDYLAAGFVSDGWSIKRTHRRIMNTRAYRMSSRPDNPKALALDQDNRLLWRQNLRRVEAEVVRDTILAASGSLNKRQGGPSVFPTLPASVHGTQDSSGKGWADSLPAEHNRRSVYLVVKRALKIPLLESLDFANCTSPAGMRSVTTTAPQALMLLNDVFVQDQARLLADRVQQAAANNVDAQIAAGFRFVLQRRPSTRELDLARRLIAEQRGPGDPLDATKTQSAGLISFCRGLFNLNEMIYAD